MTNRVGILCLIMAILLISVIDFRAILALGFLYYAYKLLYRKEEPKLLDKILITSLFILVFVEIFLMVFFTSDFNTESNTSICKPNWVLAHQGMLGFGENADAYCKSFCYNGKLHSTSYLIENDTCYCDSNNCNP